MTAYRDERDTARTARRVGLGRLGSTAAELSAIPGWLTVGPPERLVDPEQHGLAVRAVELRARLERMHRGIAALDAELDALDGPQTASIRLFLEWSRWLESVPDAATLLAQLVPDPRRMFLGTQPAMTADTAQRIIEAVAGNGGRVGSGDPFIAAAGLVDDDVWDLTSTAKARLDPLPDGHVLGVLLPMRLETRYREPGLGGGPWLLRVRVHPDPVALAGTPAPPNDAEAGLVAACWTSAAGDLGTEAGTTAFRTLAAAVGGARAAYLLRTVVVVPDGAAFVAVGSFDPPGDGRGEQRVALPDTLQLWGDAGAGAGMRLLGELHPDGAAIAAQADLGAATMADLLPDRIPELWWTSYAAAERVGLAIEVPLPDGQHLDVLMVTGLSDRSADEVFAAHADHGELAVVAPMSPTNTVAGQPAADLGRDPATWLEVSRAGGSGTAAGLAGVLTGAPLLDGVPEADTTMLDVVRALVVALWPPLWQRWLKDVEHAASIYELGDWAARLLSPLGPYPALRIGTVPYGVLPIAAIDEWESAAHDPVWEPAVVAVAAQVLPAWAAAGAAGGTAVGATPERLLDVIGRVPTSRQLGTRQFVPLEALAVIKAITTFTDPAQVVAEWEAMAAASLAVEPRPQRRYQSFGRVQPPPRDSGIVAETLRRYLEEPVENLAYNEQRREVDEGVPLLVRLLRHSLLLTAAEATRLGEGFATWTAPYEIPLHLPARLAMDAAAGSPVEELPDVARDRLAQHPPDPRAVTVARQFVDVRRAVRDLEGYDVELLPGGRFFPAFAAVSDTSSHRFDPWVTALATRRLRRLGARDVPRRIGAYGWVDDLDPSADPTPPTRAGFLHAPGNAQALAAAVLRDHAISDDDARWSLQVRSDLARLAQRLGADVRIGIHISEALGREIERRAGDPAVVLRLRRDFPARPEWKGRRVCDGQAVLAATPAALPAELGPLDDLRQVVDTYADLLVADAVHDVVGGRPAAAQESMEAAAGLGAPPELRLLRTRREGASVRTTVLVALPPGEGVAASPVTVADPAFAALLLAEVGPASAWTWATDAASCTLVDLGLDVADVVVHHQTELDALAAAFLGGPPTAGTAAQRRADLDRLGALVGTQDGLPDLVGGPEAATAELRARLAALRVAAEDLAAALAPVDPPDVMEARRWGLPAEGAADALAARRARAGDALTDATADATTLGARIRALVAPVSGLPLICTATAAPPTTPADDLDRSWLEIVAAVRPAVARLEAHQLRTPWPSAATDPARLWTSPAASQRDVVVYGPAAGSAGPVALALLDDWAETVPGPRHTTHAALGFDAPRARAPQSILLAVPPDERVPLTAAALPAVVLAARRLARARMAQPDGLRAWSLAVPASMFLTTGPAGSTLVDPA